jgi:hypothetical protein
MTALIPYRPLVTALALAVLLLPSGNGRATDNTQPLIGAAYARWGVNGCDTSGMGIVPTYGERGIRIKVRRQLAAMHASGLSSLRLLLWHSDQPDLQSDVLSSATGRLEEPYRRNLIEFLTDIRAAGFASLTVDFGPVGPNDPIGNPNDDIYQPSLLDQNWSFIKDVRPLVKRYGPARTRIDLLSEGAPSDYWPFKQRMMDYITEMYRRYADAFGTDDVVVSAIAPPEPNAGITQPDGGHRLQNLIDALRASGRSLPSAFSVHVSTWWNPSAANTLYGLRQEDAVLTANGLTQPVIVSETIYDDQALAQAIEEFRQTSTRPILEVQEWPLQQGSACHDFSVAPPFRADQYIQALTGKPPETTIRAVLSESGHLKLTAPYGKPATALPDGTYALIVVDRSNKLGLRIVGPGVRRETGRRATGSTTWHLKLRRGKYAFGTDAKLHFRIVVL